jgi:hypothetical protein
MESADVQLVHQALGADAEEPEGGDEEGDWLADAPEVDREERVAETARLEHEIADSRRPRQALERSALGE